MEPGKVSVVLPIYNVEKYLDRCIRSVVNQSYRNLEIILVDDESPDRCPEICENWAKKDSRIKVIHKKNEGLGMARNTGIENATGEYICFFDSDDYISPDAIEKAYRRAKEENADIVTFGMCRVHRDGTMGDWKIPQPQKWIYEGKAIQEAFLAECIAPNAATGEDAKIWLNAWTSLYSMNLISRTNWRFVSERKIIAEDIYSLLDLYAHVNKAVVIPEVLYFYCENMTSLTHTYLSDRYERIKIFYDACMKLCEKHSYNATVKNGIAHHYLSSCICAMKMIVLSDKDFQRKKNEFKKIIMDEHMQTVIKGYARKREKLARKALIVAMKHKCTLICYGMVKMKT